MTESSAWAAALLLAGCACGQLTDVADSGDAAEHPSCMPSADAADASETTPPSDPGYLPGSCDEILATITYPDGRTEGSANALVQLGTTIVPLGRWSGGPLQEDDTQGNVFNGARLSFAPVRSCDPVVTLTILDMPSAAPYDLALDAPLCPGSALHNVSVLVRNGVECLLLSPGSGGTLHVDVVDPASGPTRGTLDATVRPLGATGPTQPLHLTFDLSAATGGVGGSILYTNLCAP